MEHTARTMAALLPLIALFLVIAGAGGGKLVTAALGTDDATLPTYSSASEVMAYWKRVLPNSPMPLAVVEHLSACADDGKVSFQQTFHGEREDEKVTFRWGPSTKGNDGRVTFRWGSHTKNDDEKVTFGWGPTTNGQDEEINFRPETQMKGDDGRLTFSWGSHTEKDNEKVTLQWGLHHQGDDRRVAFTTNPHIKKDDDHKVTFEWGPPRKDDEKVTFGWGPNTENDDQKVTYRRDSNMDGDIEKVIGLLGTDANGGDDKITLRWRSDDQNIASLHHGSHMRERHHQVHDTDGQFDLANLLFLEAVLTPGTLLAPYIEPSVFPAPFLRREIADSIPISTNNFTDILSMFAPMSLAMAGKIWSTLHTCEHPHPLEGEQQACATSIESMVELAASVLGTADLRAFSSSPDVPAKGVASSPASKYKVAAVRAVTSPGDEATTMTCHGMTFPYAVFYCHAVNPTRVYEVTLQISAEEDGAMEMMTPAGKKTMQVLAVCHLDTSEFDSENPFFVARGLKPGDAAVCHFLSRDSVLWAPAASTQQGHGQVTAQ